MGKRKRTAAAERGVDLNPAPQTDTTGGIGFPFRPGYLQRLCAVTKPTSGTEPRQLTPLRQHNAVNKAALRSQDAPAREGHMDRTLPADPQIRQHEQLPQTNTIMESHISSSNPLKALVCVQPVSTLYLSGVCALTLLCGSANINGYKLKILEKIEYIFAPLWAPAHRLYFSEAKRKDAPASLSSALRQAHAANEFDTVAICGTNQCILLIEGYDVKSLEWMLAAEDFTRYNTSGTSIYGQVYSNYMSVQTAVLCDQESMCLVGADTLSVPTTWVSAASAVASELSDSRTVIAGAKGVGKSTCLKYIINRLVSKNPAVCVIDCDLGQPEFTAPGLLSLHVIRTPVLSASHLNLRAPEQSFYLGEITSKNEPALVFFALEQLLEKYRDILHKWKTMAALSEACLQSSNGFSVLEEQFIEEPPPLPLLVNTDGFIRYLGAEITAGILRRVSPTHIVQLVSEKDKCIEAIDCHMSSFGGADGCVLHSIDPGRTSASRIAPVDLRSLRLVSYFLRHSNLIQGGNPSTPALNNTASDGDATVANTEFVYIKSGGLVDSSCMIAKALLLSEVFSYRMNNTRLRLLPGESIPHSLLPAAFNASIVGVAHVRKVQCLCPHGVSESKNVSLIQHEPSGSVCNFDIFVDEQSCPSCPPLLPCVSLSICRVVDTKNQMYHIISPVRASNDDVNSISSSGDIASVGSMCFLKGSMQLPTILTYISNFPHHPYISGDSVGEGSSSMKGRSNVKRRAAVCNNT